MLDKDKDFFNITMKILKLTTMNYYYNINSYTYSIDLD